MKPTWSGKPNTLLQGLISLTRSHPRGRVDWACGQTLQYRLFGYRTLRRLLEQAAERAKFDLLRRRVLLAI